MRDFWKSAGMHLLGLGPEGWLKVTPQFLLAYYTRPEIHPIDSSCAEEIRLHDELLAEQRRVEREQPRDEWPGEELRRLHEQRRQQEEAEHDGRQAQDEVERSRAPT